MVRFSIFAKNGTDMEDKLISRYDILVNRYKELVSEKLSRKDFIEYNEILFSAHSGRDPHLERKRAGHDPQRQDLAGGI